MKPNERSDTKAWQVPEAARAMLPTIGSKTFVVPLQNGVDAADQLAAVLGRQHVLGGLCSIISFVVGPGHIRHAGAEPYVAFGELDNHRSERAEWLRHAFERAGVNVEIPQDVHAALWEKLLYIASLGGLAAVTRVPVGILRSVPETRQMLEKAQQEILCVAGAHRIALREDAIHKAMDLVDSLPPDATASMQRDIMEGRPSELDFLSGAVARLGREVGVATPLHAFIYHSLLPLELRARGQI